MEEKFFNGITRFADRDIEAVFNDCFFQLTEQRTSLIYYDDEVGIYIRMTVEDSDGMNMTVVNLATAECTIFSAASGHIVCENDLIDDDVANSIVARYLSLMESFVGFTELEQ